MSELFAAGFEPDVLTLHSPAGDGNERSPVTSGPSGVLTLTPPRVRLAAEAEREFYRRKQSVVAVRSVDGDHVVAIVEVVSPGNKFSRHALRSFLDRISEMLDRRVHLLILDLFPPGPRDPRGIHAAIWEEYTGLEEDLPADKPLTLAAYESAGSVRAFVEPVAVGDELPEMPLFLRPGGHVPVPLEATYAAAFEAVPSRWRRVLAGERA